jgi:RNA polymerase sigma-B factor
MGSSGSLVRGVVRGMVAGRIALGPAMAVLDERERTILTLRFYGNLTQQQIAEKVGISQMHVSRLITKALFKLRNHLGVDSR